MTSIKTAKRKRISAYQILGWTPLLITSASAGLVVLLSVLRDL
jgi:hypothetical protein